MTEHLPPLEGDLLEHARQVTEWAILHQASTTTADLTGTNLQQLGENLDILEWLLLTRETLHGLGSPRASYPLHLHDLGGLERAVEVVVESVEADLDGNADGGPVDDWRRGQIAYARALLDRLPRPAVVEGAAG